MTFQFKKFNVEDDQSAMKVGTDAVLLGAYARIDNAKYILDIGTGSGLIALIMAQKSEAKIDAIDLDKKSIRQAAQNFKNSAWSAQLNPIHQSLQSYAQISDQKYDLIISNPPFFNQSLKSPKQEKNISKHNDALKFDELAHGIKLLLKSSGVAIIILPPTETDILINEARIESLFCNRMLEISPIIGKAANRIIIEFGHHRSPLQKNHLSIRNQELNYTPEYRELTKDFYLKF